MMRNKTIPYGITLIILFLAASLIEGCSSTEVAESKDVNQSQIYQKYSVNLNESTGDVKATAVFRFGGSRGTTLILSPPATVRVNGNEMSGRETLLSGYVYSFNSFKSNTTDIQFDYTDCDNNKFSNSITISPVAGIVCTDTLDASQQIVISWEGEPIRSGEKISCRIKDISGNKISVQSTTEGSREIRIPPEKLQPLVNGTVNIRLTRSQRINLKELNPIGGEIRGTVTSVTKISYLKVPKTLKNIDI